MDPGRRKTIQLTTDPFATDPSVSTQFLTRKRKLRPALHLPWLRALRFRGLWEDEMFALRLEGRGGWKGGAVWRGLFSASGVRDHVARAREQRHLPAHRLREF